MRHGVAVPKDLVQYADEQRPLTPKGRRKVRIVAEAMSLLKLRFDAIITSPLVRARQTAQLVAEEFEYEKRIVECEHLATGDHQKLIEWLKEEMSSKNKLLLVGHEPYLGELTGLLTAGNPSAGVAFKKAGLAFLEVPELRTGQCAVLRWLLTPKIMRKIVEGEEEEDED